MASVQREPLSWLSPKTALRKSPIHGQGLFAVSEIDAGEIVCVKGGYIFDRAARDEMAPRPGPAEIQIGDHLFIGPRRPEERAGGMVFSNHSGSKGRSRLWRCAGSRQGRN